MTQTTLLLALSLWTSILIVELIRKLRGFKLMVGGKRGLVFRYTLNKLDGPAVSFKPPWKTQPRIPYPTANHPSKLEKFKLYYERQEDYPVEYLL